MTLYRFHIRVASGLVEDEEGVDLPDLASAFRHALQSAQEYAAEASPPSDMLFEIADGSGRTVLTVPICDLVASKRPVARAHVHLKPRASSAKKGRAVRKSPGRRVGR